MIRRGDIYQVSFDPGRGSEQRGVRPALIIQNDTGNELSTKTIVAAMSSRRGPAYPFRVEVNPRESGLGGPSEVMLDQILTITHERLGRRLGHLPPHVMEQVDRALHHSLGLMD